MSDTAEVPVEAVSAAELLDMVNELRDRNVLTDNWAEVMENRIRRNEIVTKEQVLDQTHKWVNNIQFRENSNKKQREWAARAEEAFIDLGMADTADDYAWNGRSPNVIDRFMNWGGNMLEGFNLQDVATELLTLGAYVPEGAEEARDQRKLDSFAGQKRQFAKELLSSGVITNGQYRELVDAHGLLDPERSLEDVLEQLSEWDITDGVITDSLRASTTAVFRRENREAQARERLEQQNEAIDAVLTDDEKRKRRAQFESLNEEFPGRYMWNSANGQVYERGSGQLVDPASGDVIEQDIDTGELPLGITDGDLFWGKAAEAVTPWDENGIDMETYYDLLDVVENPEQYHSEGIGRFVSGGEFIGGFASDYGVVQDQEVVEQQWHSRYGEKFIESMEGTSFGDYLQGKQQTVRRPWYDPGDNWALYAGRSPEDIALQQQRLVDIGALEEGDVAYGTWGPAEAEAVRKMMVVANGNAVRLEDLDNDFWKTFWESEGAGSGAARRGFAAPSYRKLDPARVELTVQETIRRQLGRDASEDELADLGQHMLDMHRQSFAADVEALRAEFNADESVREGGTAAAAAVNDVDWEARFVQKFQQDNEAELARYDRTQQAAERQQLIGGALNNFMNQLGGGIGT